MEPTPIVPAKGAAKILGLTVRDAATVMDAGLAGRTFSSGASKFVEEAKVAKLAQSPRVEGEHPDILQVRVRAAVPDEDDASRNFKGWSADLNPADREAGVDRWWRVAPEKRHHGLLVASVCGFIVHVGQIEGYEEGAEGKVRAVLSPVSDQVRNQFLGHRMRGPAGGNTILIPASN
ncbi:hypothetical protein [Nesterenkonia aerolata]|uniref:Uncharacterized protein n=1 Tax=Nesterenkonia aerolata TaxID=3074079 RepID=A0ABU2DTE6_9MICC|nr:hypothetical protein [Nesterenkonia sp. LY-0111]MDR8019646.1 hypothetical protein [Nesterenkonia sp. LY-0111]